MSGNHHLGAGGWRPDRNLLDGLTVAAIAVDAAGVVTYSNSAARALFGASGRERDTDFREWLFDEPEQGAADEVLHQVLSGDLWTGELVMNVDRNSYRMVTSWSPVRTEGVVTGALLLLEEANNEGAYARTLAERLRKLAAVSTDLLSAATIGAVAEVVTDHLTGAAGATVGSLSLLVDEDTLVLMGLRGGSEGAASRWATYALDSDTPAAESVRTASTIVLVGRDEIRRRYPGLETAAEGDRSMVCLPLSVTGRAIGVVTLSFPGRRALDAAELQFFGILADTCAQAIERIEAQQEAADRERKLRFLAEASAQLSSDLDYESTLKTVTDMAVPWFADWCAIALEEDGALRTLSVAHADPEQVTLVEELQARYPSSPDAPRGSYQVLRTGASDLIPEISDEMLAEAARDAEHLRLLQQLSFRSAMSVPLKVQDRVLGVITWVTGVDGRRFTAADLAFGEDLARRAAVAIDNADLHSQLRDVALRLQQSVLPEQLPEVAGWDLAVRYLPAGRTGAGGDFYDALALGDGRLTFFVGDVMGRGVPATSVMAQMRSAIRTLIAVDPDPRSVVSGLDWVFERLHLEQLVTAVYAVADPARDEVLIVNAGHPSPVRLPAVGGIDVVDAPDTLILGVGGGERTVVRRPFLEGDALLLYTDGLIERRGEDIDQGLARLLSVVELMGGEDLSAGLMSLVDVVRDPTRDDDVAALAVRRRVG